MFDKNEIDKINLKLGSIISIHKNEVNRFIETYKTKNISIMRKSFGLIELLFKNPEIIRFLLFKVSIKAKYKYFVTMSKFTRKMG